MSFFDDIDKKLTMFGQGAIQKGKEVSDSARMSSAIRNLENQKKEYFSQLGEQIYINQRNIADEQAQLLIEKIDEANAEMKEIRGQLNKLKGVIHCENCHAEIPANSTFCNVCGTKVEHKEMSNVNVAGGICSKCGAELSEDQLFCMVCGTKIEKVGVYEEPVEVSGKLVCSKCGVELDVDQTFCVVCGTKVEKTKEEEICGEVGDVEERIAEVCPSCGEPVDEGQVFCIHCGTSLK